MIEMKNVSNQRIWNLEEIYDIKVSDQTPNFLEFQAIFASHVVKEEELVVPLLNYITEEGSEFTENDGQMKRTAAKFLDRYREMQEEHELTRNAAHRMRELSIETGNLRGERLWRSVEAHEKLEKASLKIAYLVAEHIFSRTQNHVEKILDKTLSR